MPVYAQVSVHVVLHMDYILVYVSAYFHIFLYHISAYSVHMSA